MAESLWIALIAGSSGVLGALAGGAATVWGQRLNAKAERRRERLRLAVQISLADHAARLDALKSGLLGKGQRVPPMPAYVDFNSRLLEALDSGPLDAEK